MHAECHTPEDVPHTLGTCSSKNEQEKNSMIMIISVYSGYPPLLLLFWLLLLLEFSLLLLNVCWNYTVYKLNPSKVVLGVFAGCMSNTMIGGHRVIVILSFGLYGWLCC